MKTAGQWALMISGIIGTLLVGLAVFVLALFPSCAPLYCAKYSPLPRQVVEVYLTWWERDDEDYRPHHTAHERIVEDLRARAIPALEAVLRNEASTQIELYFAFAALCDLGVEARGSVPAILVGMRSPNMLRDWGLENSPSDHLVKLGFSVEWRAGLTDRDPWISRQFIDAARRLASAEAFIELWDLLRTDQIVERKETFESLDEFFYPEMKKDLKAKIGNRLDEVIANGPADMVQRATALRRWLNGESESQ